MQATTIEKERPPESDVGGSGRTTEARRRQRCGHTDVKGQEQCLEAWLQTEIGSESCGRDLAQSEKHRKVESGEGEQGEEDKPLV